MGITTTEEEHKLETFGRIPNFSVCCAKANGHGPFHIRDIQRETDRQRQTDRELIWREEGNGE